MSQTHRSSSSPSWIFSLVGVIIAFVLLLLVNFIVKRALPVQFDLTEDKLHTLSDGTKQILRGLDTPVKLSYFVSRDKDNTPPALATFAEKVDALLDEYEGIAKSGMLEIERINPEPDSDEQDQADLNGLQAIPGRFNEPVYLGLTVTCLDRKSSIPIIVPDSEQLLEYEITRKILEVSRESAAKIGVMSALPVAGGMPAMPFPQAGRPQPQRPWQFYNELKRDYDPDTTATDSNVISVELDAEAIPEDVDVLLVVHPGGISDKAQFAIDQFVLRGGSLVAFLDPLSVVAAQSRPQQPPFGGQPPPSGPPVSSNLERLLPAWGVEFEANQVLADRSYEVEQRRGEVNPTILQVSGEAVDEDDSLTGSMRDFTMYMAGVFYVEDKDGIEAKTLMHSSSKSQLVSSSAAQAMPNTIVSSFEASGKEYPLVVRLTGSFKTAFPEGKPGEEEEDAADDGNKDDPKEKEEEKPPKKEWLKESQGDGSVLLVADTDMLFDQLAYGRDLFGGMRVVNHNVPLLLGAIEQAAGGADLISIRSRGSTRRPFSKFKQMRDEASKALTKEIAKVDEEEKNFAAEISKLMQDQGNNQMVVLSPEAAQSMKELREKRVEAAKRRRELSRELRKDIKKIENNIKLANIAIVPLLILALGIVHLFIRRAQVSAR